MVRTRGLMAAAGTLALASLALAACSSGNPLDTSSSAAGGSSSGSSVVVGSAAFPENEILAYVYADALNQNGIKATVKPNIGQRDAYIAALKDGSIDLVPEYTGNLLQYFDAKATAQSSDDVYNALKTAVPSGYGVLAKAEAQDADSYNVTKAFSDQYGVKSLDDLKKVTIPLKVAANPEFQTRPYGIPGLKSEYGVTATLVPISDGGGPNTVKALTGGDVQLADIYSTTPAIKSENLVTLSDPKNMILAQNVVPLISDKAATDKVKAVLEKVQAALTTDDLIQMNTKSSVDKESADQIAKEWLKSKSLF
ncbi:ABC transporter substrate-binding protein [Microbacterium rhizosphaerae]|uniref:ABC transporter substrate-binding protein n=1 Tax=Microbacterium rhizosphaerae TaxID=1678237 RepID=A0ABZ0SSK4_9MICO|nr:ABC transporter substrate-binding protein [Microbacterium rhizosphaerae]WPR91130.1 ABC transporter substrate-binding protein [Microbacterium rhizosphaerae]